MMQHDLTLHSHLIGVSGSRRDLNTPVLTVDREVLDRNIARMAAIAKQAGVVLRPHAKTHKSVDIAKRQIAAGAIGVCCAKLGEAEALAEGGIDDILITSPVVSAPAIARLVRLNERIHKLAVVVDNPENAIALSRAIGPRSLRVLIDVDPGTRRTGVSSAKAALELHECVQRAGNLEFQGVQFYCGVHQHIGSFAERAAAIEERTDYLRRVLDAFGKEAAGVPIVSGSGTGTHRIDGALGVFTEWQVGSYVFMDRQYSECDLAGDGTQAFEYSLFVEARVVSANTPGMATIDAGIKALSTDGGSPVIVAGAPAGCSYRFMGDEHGAIVDPASKHTWRIGEMVRLAVPHCDPTVNLYDAYHVLNGDTLEAIWPVSARGRSR
jgi:D-serine deaminase-like pyridoxal phosphate-dependent protein